MSASKGSLVLLKISNGENPPHYATVAGMRTTLMTINRQPVTVPEIRADAWRKLHPQAGNVSMRLQGNGVFTGSDAEQAVLAQVMAGTACGYHFCFGNGDRMEAECIVVAYERGGKVGDMESFSLTLESAGTVTYTPHHEE